MDITQQDGRQLKEKSKQPSPILLRLLKYKPDTIVSNVWFDKTISRITSTVSSFISAFTLYPKALAHSQDFSSASC